MTFYGNFVEILNKRITKAHQITQECSKNVKRHKDLYEVKVVETKYKPGDVVGIMNETRSVGGAPKLQDDFNGPGAITDKIGELDFMVWKDKTVKDRLAHHDKLIEFIGDNHPKWINTILEKIRKSIEKQKRSNVLQEVHVASANLHTE